MMPVKMTGAQYKAFLAAEWGPDAYWEDTEIAKNGEVVDVERDGDPDFYLDSDEVEIRQGCIVLNQAAPLHLQETVDAVKFARKWLKSQTHVTLMVEVDRQDVDFWKSQIEGTSVDKRKAKVKVVG